MIGTVEKYNGNKGFGFIKGSDGQQVFVLYQAVKFPFHHALKAGQKVKYATAPGPRGLQAVKVRLIK